MITDNCETFRTWNRIEGSTRTKNMEESLKAEIYDPLWMLARQWQFGEFQANDCGSAAKVLLSYCDSKIVSLNLGGQNNAYSFDKKPPEAMVESALQNIDYKSRLQAGNQFFKIVTRILNQELSDKLRNVFLQDYPLRPRTDCKEEENRNNSNDLLQSFFAASSKGGVDGVLLYKAGKNNRLQLLDSKLENGATGNIGDALLFVIDQFNHWFESLYDLPSEQESAWNSSRMEYQFSCKLEDNSLLNVDEYYSGDLDWYNFDLNDSAKNSNSKSEKVKEYIPTPLEYAGMPSARWWEIEDAKVDLVNIEANNVDLAKLIVSEYAMMYSNDWMIAPLDVSLGSYIQLKGVIVVDLFGEYTSVDIAQNSTSNSSDAWSEWSMFALTNVHNNNVEQGMLLFPSLQTIQESKPLEEVVIARDESANMVWAVEERITDQLGSNKSGRKAVEDLHNHLGITENKDTEEGLNYMLGSTVPEHWIPFISVKAGKNTDREMKLQRASMPRITKDTVEKVRPVTSFMRVDIDQNNHQIKPFYLYEEEVPMGGITITRTEQRARWFDGKTINWQGFKKEAGKGTSQSGLKFDSLIDS